MKDTIQVEVVSKWGRELYYPECDLAKMFCKLAKTETVTQDMMKIISSYGIKIEDATPRKTFN